MLPNAEKINCYKKPGKENVTKTSKIKLLQNAEKRK